MEGEENFTRCTQNVAVKICITLQPRLLIYVVVDATRNFLKKVAFAFGGSILNDSRTLEHQPHEFGRAWIPKYQSLEFSMKSSYMRYEKGQSAHRLAFPQTLLDFGTTIWDKKVSLRTQIAMYWIRTFLKNEK